MILYYALPLKVRWTALLVFSAVFAFLCGWQGAAHLAAVSLNSWGGALWLSDLNAKEKAAEDKTVSRRYARRRKAVLAAFLFFDIGAMALIKYYPSVAQWLNGWLWADFRKRLPAFQLAVPLGLSYFTFQLAGYLIDVYRGKAEAIKNPLRVMLFGGYFLQLPQGPVSTLKDLEPQLTKGHPLEPQNIVSGFQRMVWGYFKKLVIADRLASATAALLTENELPGWFALGGVILYTVRLYADFSGGMDVVRGISRMMGIRLTENFRRPFFAQSVAEYWRRWHITLGAWFRSYVLYPLAVSRAGIQLGKRASALFGKKTGRMVPTALATLIVFLLIGIWHAANWNAVIYGAYFGLIMAVSMLLEPLWKAGLRRCGRIKKGLLTAFRLFRTWALVLAAQYFAFTLSPSQGFSLLRQTFSGWDFSHFSDRVTGVMPSLEWGIAGAGLIVMVIVDLIAEKKPDLCDRLAGARIWIRWPVLLLMLVSVLVFGFYGQGFDSSAFLYTQF